MDPSLCCAKAEYNEKKRESFLHAKQVYTTGGVDGKIALTNDLTMNFTIIPISGKWKQTHLKSTSRHLKPILKKAAVLYRGQNIFNFRLTAVTGISAICYSIPAGRQNTALLSGPWYNEYADMPASTHILGSLKFQVRPVMGFR
jgi:hypothetical protein